MSSETTEATACESEMLSETTEATVYPEMSTETTACPEISSSEAIETIEQTTACPEMSSETTPEEQATDLTSVVAEHYNQLEEKGLAERTRSKIFHMRNFNNWIKSMLIGEFLAKVKEGHGSSSSRKKIHILDIGSGKGGDLLKWKKGCIHHLVCTDIAETSLEQCQQRYNDMMNRERGYDEHFYLECIPADSTKARLKELYSKPDIKFDIVSAQFSFHYCFESLPQAQCMLRNVSESLKPGGFFIGTTPDAFDIVRRLRESDSLSFGNDIFNVTFDSKDDIPLFGAKYAFHLEGVVDCPEFLVYFPVLVELASQFGLKLLYRERFEDYFKKHIKDKEGLSLLGNMQALQTYPSQDKKSPADGESESKEFEHAEKYMEEHKLKSSGAQDSRRNQRSHSSPKVGTLSQQEWEAVSIYIVYAFVREETQKEKEERKKEKETKEEEDAEA